MNKKVSLCCIFYETETYFQVTAWCRGATNIGMILEVENWGRGTKTLSFLTEERHPDFAKFPIGCCTDFPKPEGRNPDFTNTNTIFSFTDNVIRSYNND